MLGLFLLVCVLSLPDTSLGQLEEPKEAPGEGPEVKALRITEIATARGYDRAEKAPVDTASVFPADVGRVICYSRIVGAPSPMQITHVWYHEGKTMAKVQLPVGSANWRTYSSKKIWPAWIGSWEVKILDQNGVELATKVFTIE
jgi:hypothetical protein